MNMCLLLWCIIVAVASATSVELVPSTAHVARDSDYTQACADEFGPDASVADWDTIITTLSDTELQTFYSDYDVQPFGKRLLVVRGGSMVCNEGVCTSQAFVRKYFVERHDGNPPASWDVFGQHAGLTLGSWHGGSMQVLCAIVGTTTTTTSVYYDCAALPMSMNGYAHPHGCPGAVWADGSPSLSYCGGRNGLFPWWSACCHWDGTACAVGPATTSAGIATTTSTTSRATSSARTTTSSTSTIQATTTSTLTTTTIDATTTSTTSLATSSARTTTSSTSTIQATTTSTLTSTTIDATTTSTTSLATSSAGTTTSSTSTMQSTTTSTLTLTTMTTTVAVATTTRDATTTTKASATTTTTFITRASTTITATKTATTTTIANTPTTTTRTTMATTTTTMTTTATSIATETATRTITRSINMFTSTGSETESPTTTEPTTSSSTSTTFVAPASTRTNGLTTTIEATSESAVHEDTTTTSNTMQTTKSLPSNEQLTVTTLPSESATSMSTTSKLDFPVAVSGMDQLSPTVASVGTTTTSTELVLTSTNEETVASLAMLNGDQHEFPSPTFTQTTSMPSNFSTNISSTPSLIEQPLRERTVAAFASFFQNGAALFFVMVFIIGSALLVACMRIGGSHRRKPSDEKITFDDIEAGPVAPLSPKIVVGVPTPTGAPPRIFLAAAATFQRDPVSPTGAPPCMLLESCTRFLESSTDHTPWETESIPLASHGLRSKGLGSKGLGSMGIGSKIIRSMRQGLPGTISSPLASRGVTSPFSNIGGPQERI